MFVKMLLKSLLFIGLTSPLMVLSAEWVWPTLPTSKAVVKQYEVVQQFDYKEYSATSTKIVDLQAENRGAITPESLFAARFSAIKALDYQSWWNTWSPESVAIVEDYYHKKGYDEAFWLNNWRGQYANANFKLVRKIEYQDFVFLTYKTLYGAEQKSVLDVEYPMVFKPQGTMQWGVSMVLRASPLIVHSPWVAGISEKRVRIK